MYVMVDMIGDNITRQGQIDGGDSKIPEKPWFFTPVFKRFAWLKDMIAYIKEYRYVLCDYFRWKRVPSPAWRCKGCSKRGEWFCVDCNKKWCPQCCYNMHAPGSIT